MPTVIKRFLVLAAVMFWQGGFTFYSAVVVHVGRDVLGSHLEQGFITRSVTEYLNLAGAIALFMWGWDIVSVKDSTIYRRWLRGGLWILLTLALGFLAWQHLRLDEHLDPSTMHIDDRVSFRQMHAWYLHMSTAQWVGSLVLLLLTLQAWRSEDVSRPPPLSAASNAIET